MPIIVRFVALPGESERDPAERAENLVAEIQRTLDFYSSTRASEHAPWSPAVCLTGALGGEEEVRALVTAVRETSVFPLVDAIVEGRPAAAVRLLRQVLRQESGVPYILAMIQRQLRHLALAREMMDAGASSRRIGEVLRLPDFALDRLLGQVPRYPPQRLRAAFRRLLEADLQIKRGIYHDELALELLVHDLARI